MPTGACSVVPLTNRRRNIDSASCRRDSTSYSRIMTSNSWYRWQGDLACFYHRWPKTMTAGIVFSLRYMTDHRPTALFRDCPRARWLHGPRRPSHLRFPHYRSQVQSPVQTQSEWLSPRKETKTSLYLKLPRSGMRMRVSCSFFVSVD